MVVADHDDVACGERLELLAVVRGLEALDGPSRVTLVTKSRYVSRGLRFGMMEWRANGWQWERFGRVVPVKDRDLWQRIDRALLFHQVECQAWQFEDAAVTDEPLCRRDPIVPVGAAKSRYSESWPQAATVKLPRDQTLAQPASRLAPTKRRLARPAAAQKRCVAADSHDEKPRSLTAALVGKAAAIREAIREFADTSHHYATGAA